MAKIHMIYGKVGAGKSTHALKISKENKTVILGIDEWMATLYSKDSSNPPNLDWMLERTQRCEEQMWKIADQLLSKDINVIFDLGFYRRDHRFKFLEKVRTTGHPYTIQYIVAPDEVRRKRVRERNKGKSETYHIEVSDTLFDWAEKWFEEPSDEEIRYTETIQG